MAKQSYFFTFLFLSLLSHSSSTTTHLDVLNPPTIFPTFPPVTSNPATTIPLNPPVITIPPKLTPPVTQYPPTQPSGTVPVPSQPVVSNSGQSWCVAKPGASQISLQQALDYACGIGGVDCSQIQQGGKCYSPISLQNHASFAFNSYYQKKPSPQSCDFGGAASVVNTNPSTSSCIYQTSLSTSTGTTTTTPTPSTQTMNQPPPATSLPINPTGGGINIGFGTPPTTLNQTNPTSSTLNNQSSGDGAAVYGFDGSPNGNKPTSSDSTHLQIHFGLAMVATLIFQVHALLFH